MADPGTSRPRASLGRVLDDLGATLLELVRGEPERATDVGGVVIHDPLDDPAVVRDPVALELLAGQRLELLEARLKLGSIQL